MNEIGNNAINEIDTDSGAYWESLSYVERRVAIQAITEWQEKVKIRERIEELRRDILAKINEFYDLVDWQEMDDLMTELNDAYN